MTRQASPAAVPRSGLTISVVIPTYRRPQSLRRALVSLASLRVPPDEVIVVDNADDPAVRELATEFGSSTTAPVRFLVEPRLGLHFARNTGAQAASGEVLVFTDDDATVDSGWTGAYHAAFTARPGLAAAGGTIRPAWEAEPPPFIREMVHKAMARSGMFPAFSLLDLQGHGDPSGRSIFFGVNMAVRRDVLFELGGFDPEAFGEIWLGDGETGLNRRLWQLGLPVGYVPDAVVNHHIDETRLNVQYLRRRMRNEGAAEAYALFRSGALSRPSLGRALLGVIATDALWWVADWFVRGSTRGRLVSVQLRAERTRARAAYLIRLLRDTRFRTWAALEPRM